MQPKGGTSRSRQYPVQLDDLANLPTPLRLLAEQALPPAELAQTIFLIPGQMLSKKFGGLGGMHWVPEQALIFTARGVAHFQAGKSPEENGTSCYLPGDRLLYARVSLVILYAQMEFFGVVNGEQRSIRLAYNSVSHELMQPAFLNFLRLSWENTPPQVMNNFQNLLMGRLDEQSFKFRSGLEKHCLQDGEYLQGFVFQPRLLKQYLRFIQRLIAPASLFALTDRQLILIEEGMTSATSYGYFFTFCPLANVVKVEAQPGEKLYQVQIQLTKDAISADFQLTQESTNALACQDLWARRFI